MTDTHTGERLRAVGVQEGDVVVADRGYGVWSTIRLAVAQLAYFVIHSTT